METPRDVYRAACADVAARFADRGFVFLKSQGSMRRSSGGEFTHWVHFGTTKWNRSGQSVGFGISALNVRSQRLERWRLDAGHVERGDWVAGGLVRNLGFGSREHDLRAFERLARSLLRPTTRRTRAK